MRLRLSLSLFALLSTAAAPSEANAGVILDLHGWKWQDIMATLPAIQSAGYTAILISPHTSTCSGGFGQGFDPYDYTNFNSGFGSHSDLYWLVGSAHWHGVQIYADMVMNHMCPVKYDGYPKFSWNDFHHNGGITNWDDTWQVENAELVGLADLAHESPYVREQLWNFLVQTNDMGFDGYRWDAAKHVPVWYWRDHVVHNVNGWGKYNFGEVVSGDPAKIQPYLDAGMSLTDFALYDAVHANFRYGGDLSQLDGVGLAARNGAAALTFVENHDFGPPPNRLLAYAFLAAYPGYPSFYNVPLGDPDYTNLVWIQKHLAHGTYRRRHREKDVLIFEREGHLLAGLNQSGHYASRWVYTSWRNTKLHDFAGHIGDRWTNDAGWVEVVIPPGSYVMLAP